HVSLFITLYYSIVVTNSSAVFLSIFFFFFSSRRRHTRSKRDWSSDVCSSDLIIFAIISITPPVDSFSVSRANQITLLKNTLIENDMLEDGEIVPNEDISEKDQTTIT